MDWRMDTWSLSMWVSPFRYPRITGYLLLTVAFRSLSRLSSALSAKASALCSYSLNHIENFVFELQISLAIFGISKSMILYIENSFLITLWVFSLPPAFLSPSVVTWLASFVVSVCFEKFDVFSSFFWLLSWRLILSSRYSVFKVRHDYICMIPYKCNYNVNPDKKDLQMETKRFELSTPCLQGRCSPNWAKPPKSEPPGFDSILFLNPAATCFPISSPI